MMGEGWAIPPAVGAICPFTKESVVDIIKNLVTKHSQKRPSS